MRDDDWWSICEYLKTIYIVGDSSDLSKPVKIGITDDITTRLKALQTGSYYNLSVIYSFKGETVHERHLHKMFQDKRVNGEWFLLTQEDIRLIKYASESFAPAKWFNELSYGAGWKLDTRYGWKCDKEDCECKNESH